MAPASNHGPRSAVRNSGAANRQRWAKLDQVAEVGVMRAASRCRVREIAWRAGPPGRWERGQSMADFLTSRRVVGYDGLTVVAPGWRVTVSVGI